LEVLAGGDAKGQRIRYEYDKAIRLIALVNENNAAYQFAYDASDRLTEEKRIDNLTRRFSYNLGGHLTRVDEIGYGERAERPQRSTEFERDEIGRLLAKVNQDARQDYIYDESDRLLSITRLPTATGKKLGVSEETLSFEYDLLGRLIKETTPQGALDYEYDPLSNLTTLTLPTGQHLNHMYYGSGHLHQLNLDGLYEYEANGQLPSRDTGRLVDSGEFRYDAATNRLNFNTSQFDQVIDNRIKRWRDQEYA